MIQKFIWAPLKNMKSSSPSKKIRAQNLAIIADGESNYFIALMNRVTLHKIQNIGWQQIEDININKGSKNKLLPNQAAKTYPPYLQLAEKYFFKTKNSKAVTDIDLFVPIYQTPFGLFFTDIKLSDYTGTPFSWSSYFGYRHLLLKEQQIYGIYISFIRKRTNFNNYFNQITLGGECWIKKLFIGGNIYKPLGKTLKPINEEVAEKSMFGANIEIGYELVTGLTSYVSGYCFKAKEVDAIYGLKARLRKDWALDQGRKILEIFDRMSFEIGLSKDRTNRGIWYANLSMGINLSTNKHEILTGVSRHMLGPIYQHTDIVSNIIVKKAKNSVSTNLPKDEHSTTINEPLTAVQNTPPPINTQQSARSIGVNSTNATNEISKYTVNQNSLIKRPLESRPSASPIRVLSQDKEPSSNPSANSVPKRPLEPKSSASPMRPLPQDPTPQSIPRTTRTNSATKRPLESKSPASPIRPLPQDPTPQSTATANGSTKRPREPRDPQPRRPI